MAFQIHLHQDLQDEIQRLAQRQRGKCVAEIQARRKSVQNVVHSVRKHIKRLRGLLRLVRQAMPTQFRDEDHWFRDQARTIAESRDAVVLLNTLGNLRKQLHGKLTDERLADIRQGLQQLNFPQTSTDEQWQLLGHIAEKLKAAEQRVDAWSIDGDLQILFHGFLKQYRKARRNMNAVREDRTTEGLHHWRKQVKYHASHCHLLERVAPRKLRQRIKASHDLGVLLGEDHDLAMLSQIVAENPTLKLDDNTTKLLAAAIHQKRQTLQKRSFKLGRKLFNSTAAELAKRLFERKTSTSSN